MSENDHETVETRSGLRSDRVLYSVSVTDSETGKTRRRGFLLTGWRARLLGWIVSLLVAALIGWVLVAFVVGSWVMLSDLWRAL